MNILCYWLINLVPQSKHKGRRESVTSMTNKIIRKHQKIIIFSEYIEDLYTYIALVQFISNTLLMCSLGFLIVTVSKKHQILLVLNFRLIIPASVCADLR
jgi:hypothetical protein